MIVKNLTRVIALTLIICSTTFGCGYHFRKAGRPIGKGPDSIAIPLFSSTSTLVGIEGDFTRIVRQEFIRHSRVRMESKANAQTVLSGRIYSIMTEPLAYEVTQHTINSLISTDEVTSSRWLIVRLDVRLTDRGTGKIIWQDSNLTGKVIYAVSSDPLMNQYNERQALISIARDLATRVYAKTMERF